MVIAKMFAGKGTVGVIAPLKGLVGILTAGGEDPGAMSCIPHEFMTGIAGCIICAIMGGALGHVLEIMRLFK